MSLWNKLNELDTLIICATENQVVNYSSLKFENKEFQNVYSIIVVGDTNKFNNFDLHNRLARVREEKEIEKLETNDQSVINEMFQNDNIILINKGDILSGRFFTKEIEDKIAKKKILWNLTGGQKKLTILLQQYVNKNKGKTDLITYLDGNIDEFFLFDLSNGDVASVKNSLDIELDTQLKLLGIISDNEDKNNIEYKNKEYIINQKTEITDIDTLKKLEREILSFTKKYIEDSGENRKKIVGLNSGDSMERNTKNKEYIQNLFEQSKIFNDYTNLIYDQYDKGGRLIGKLFEKMIFFELAKLSRDSNKIKSIYLDYSYYDKDFSYPIDQIDILINLKSGKLIIIECKTGGMSSDNSKSTNFTAYKMSGVYGLPILLVPITKKEIKDYLDGKKIEEYKNVMGAVRAAERNGMKYYGIDELEILLNTINE